MKRFVCVILAAGKGKRMKSKTAKVLHPLCGKPMMYYVIKMAFRLNPVKIVVVVGRQKEKVMKEFTWRKTVFAHQDKLLGTGDAVKQTERILENVNHTILILAADTPLLTGKTVEKMLKLHSRKRADITLLTTYLDEPKGYGRIIREGKSVVRIVEEKDATRKQKQIKEINAGVYVFNKKKLFRNLKKVKPKNIQKEYYLTDVVKIIAEEDGNIQAVQTPDWKETMGVNNRWTLSRVTDIMESKIMRKFMEDGVTFDSPATTFVDYDVKIGKDTVVKPCVSITGLTTIGKNCTIHSHTAIENCIIGDNVTIGAHSLLSRFMIRPNVKLPAYSGADEEKRKE